MVDVPCCSNAIVDIGTDISKNCQPVNIDNAIDTNHKFPNQQISTTRLLSIYVAFIYFIFHLNQQNPKAIRLSKPKAEELTKRFRLRPYPNEVEIMEIAREIKASVKQVSSWFSNKRWRSTTYLRDKLRQDQKMALLESVSQNSNPEKAEVRRLSKTLGLHRKTVLQWFDGYRSKQQLGVPFHV